MSDPIANGAAVALTGAVKELALEVEGLRGDLAKRTKRLWRWVLGVGIVGAVVLTGVVIYLILAIIDIRQNEKASCVAFAGVGNPALLRPEAGALARQVVQDHAAAARELGCATPD